ncbi:MAG TPA: hypothetical protein PLA61_14510 [Ferruginibacter sp.]|jgi:hypothetical protein|nr:hypothetical protein [Ferruginibacter sp.]HQR02061.1 hypothetical protein [Ferruginibacter sp.]
MKKIAGSFFSIVLLVILYSCSKKVHPAESKTTTSSSSSGTETRIVKKTPAPKTAVPKVIVVNDQVAKRSVDGRYYYDLEGRRYWRNNRDGKYYLYYKGIFDNPDFKAPGNN